MRDLTEDFWRSFASKGFLIAWMMSILVMFLPALGNAKANSSSLPGQTCQAKPVGAWSIQEKWVWQKVCVGEIADLKQFIIEEFGKKVSEPKKKESLKVLSPIFLETILLHNPYRKAVTRQGIRIIGAKFTKGIDLTGAQIAFPLWLLNSTFEKALRLKYLQTPYLLIFQGSKFSDVVDLDSVKVGQNLFLRQAKFTQLILRGAQINGQLDMSGSIFSDTVDMDAIKVRASVFLDRAQFREVRLRGATVGGQLDLGKSTFNGKVDMDSVSIERNLLIRDVKMAALNLLNAKIKGQVDIRDSSFSGELNLDSMDVARSFFLRNSEIQSSEPIKLWFSTFGDNLDLSGSSLGSVNLTGTKIRGELRLYRPPLYGPTKWRKESVLILRNVQVGALQDSPESWPSRLELDGLAYSQLGGFTATSTNDMATRSSQWFIEWLGRQRHYSPQPYEHLAATLSQAGQDEKANDILFAGKNRERGTVSWYRWLGLTILKLFIGFGYRIYYLIFWVSGLILIGALVFRNTKEAKEHQMPIGIIYSLDMLLPFIQLRERHYSIDFQGWQRYYFYFHKLMGYAAASLLIAGLSGLVR